MAANQGLPMHFFDALEQSMSSNGGVLCFLAQMDPSLAYKHPESILRNIQASDGRMRHCLELVLSSGLWADPLGGWLLHSFPTTVPTTPKDCLHLSILQRLVKYVYFSAPQTEAVDELVSLQDDVQLALHAPEAIEKLASMRFDDGIADEVDEGDSKGSRSRKRPSQAERKRQLQAAFRKKKEPLSEVEVALHALGISSTPTSLGAAQELALRVLLDSKDLLAKYLAFMRTEQMSEAIRSSLSDQHTGPVKRKPRTEPIITNLTHSDVVSPMTASAFETPLKAALYFDSASDLGDWEVVVSGRAIRDIRAAQKRDPASFKIIMKKINELSHSHFSDDNQKVLVGGSNAVPVYEAKMTSDSRLVYHIHCQPDHLGEQERQVIRIFGVFTHTQLDRVWESLGYQLARLGGKEYRSRCCQRVFNRARNIIVPAVFPHSAPADAEPISIPELPAEDLEEIHSILVLEKFVNLSKELRNSFIADLDVQHVFNLSSQEMAIIEHPFSCYVLGRSGTGKTTTMLFKMLGLERTFASLQLADFEATRPRQLFVTQSPVLASRVEDYFTKLIASLELGQKSELDLMKLAAERARHRTPDRSRSMVHKKDSHWKANLPDKFSSLRDEHFPLFLTFEQLAALIIGDILDPDSSWMPARRDSLDKQATLRLDRIVSLLSSSRDVLTFADFIAEYWARFPRDLTKGLDPALVFSEILGVIKGAEQSISCEGRCLDRNTYLSLGRRSSHLPASIRETIFQLFVKYSQRKRQLRGYDAADRTHALLEVFALVGVPGTRVDFLYVDEAQDNRLIDAMLLRSICKNPSGLFWAGDTAQTIAIGNSFRFQDLKSFIYRLEERRGQSLDIAPVGSFHKPADFILATNYRSHGGIIACAHSVIEMITRFWPASLDKMAPEKGIVNGIKPLFIVNRNPGSFQFRHLMNDGESDIEFGAAQCILVRDNAARDKLLEEVGEVGIIMTLYDSKGLEFDDVLLYRFFEDSNVDMKRWRVLLNMMPEHARPPAPHFDPILHASLCSELKFLYVAVTRARKKLWIYDSSETASPLQHVWAFVGLIDDFDSSGGRQLPRFASTSSRQEWQEAAERLFDNENYAEAVIAFKRAKCPRQAAVAQAYQLRKEAELTMLKSAREKLYRTAASAFLLCAEEAVDDEGPKAFRRVAGLCFCHAEDYAQAGAAYRAAEQYGSALQMYRKVGMFDEGVEIVKGHACDIKDKALVADFKDIAKVFYFKEQEISKAQELFDSSGEVLPYLEGKTFLDESRARVLQSRGMTMEAANVHLSEGRLLEAVRILFADPMDLVSTAQGHSVVIQGLWKSISFGNINHIHHSDAKELVELASGFSEAYRDKVSIFLAIHRCDWDQTRELGRKLMVAERRTEALLCLSYGFHPSNLPNMEHFNNEEVARTLAALLDFCSLLRHQAENLDLMDERLQQLFNISPSQTEDTYVVSPGSWLRRIVESDPTTALAGSAERALPSQALEKRLKDALLGFTAEVIKSENNQLRTVLAFTPCLPLALTRYCKHGDKCRWQHLNREALDHPWYAAQVRIYLQQILLSQIIESIPSYLGGGLGGRRRWLSRLYETLAPSSYMMGSGLTLDWSKIPESPKALSVVQNWCRHLLNGRPGTIRSLELSSVYQATELCFRLDRDQATDYVPRSTLVHRYLNRDHAYLGLSPNGRQEFVLLDLMASLDASRPDFLEAGIKFSEHAVKNRLAIDINVLCNFVEFLCGAFVAIQHHCHWHNITLPRSWLLLLVQRMRQQLPVVNTRPLFRRLMQVLGQILRALRTGENTEHIQYGKVGANPLYLRSLCTARICRAMCIVGYNFPYDWIHSFTLEQLKPLKLFEWHSPLYVSFALADTWKDVVRAIWNSTKDSPFDDLVHLWSAEVREPFNPAPTNVRRIVFKRISHIVSLLRNEAPPVTDNPSCDVASTSSSQNTTDDQQGSEIMPDDTPAAQGSDVGSVFASRPEEDRFDHSSSLEAIDSLITLPEVEFEPQVLAAADVFCKAYQRLVKRRQCENARTPREVACRHFYEACITASGNIDWPVGSSYRKLYLGVVPHLLVVTHWIQAYITQQKCANKEALKLAKGSDFEEVLERIALVTDLEQELNRAKKTLEPRSHFHVKRDARELRQVISEVEILFRKLPRAQAEEVEFDMHMAKPPLKADDKPRKPSLKWDEDDDLYEYDE